MAKVSTNITLDSEVKAKSQKMLAEFGLDLSSAVNIFLRQMLRERAIPFKIELEEPNDVTLEALDNAENRTDVYGPFDTVDSLMEALNA